MVCVAVGIYGLFEINRLQIDSINLRNQIAALQEEIESLRENARKTIIIQGAVLNNSNTLLVHAASLSGDDVLITKAFVKDSAGNIAVTDNAILVVLPAAGTLTTVTVKLGGTTLSSGHSYTVTLGSAMNNTFVSGPFVP